MIIKFHMIVEAVFSLRIVCLCVSVCFSTLQSLFLCGNTSTGRCSLSCLDSSRLLSSLFFCFVCGLSVPRRLWTPLHTDGRFLPLSLAQLKMQSQGCCLTLLVRASLWFYTAYISQWSGYELQCCGVFVSIMRKNQKALLPEGEKHEGRHPGCLFFFSNSTTSVKTAWCFILLLLLNDYCDDQEHMFFFEGVKIKYPDLIYPKNMQTCITFSIPELCLQSSPERWRTGWKKTINYSSTTLFILLCSGHNSKGHNPKAALKHTAKTVTAINHLACSVPVYNEIPLWGYTNRGYDYTAFIDTALVKSVGSLSSTSRCWFYMLNQPKSRWQGKGQRRLTSTPPLFFHTKPSMTLFQCVISYSTPALWNQKRRDSTAHNVEICGVFF